jgi:small subunit ribosomal protein S1
VRELTVFCPQGIIGRYFGLTECGIVSVANSITLADISKGHKLEGTVKKVTLSGAIVDVGAQVDGLLHISDLGQKRVTRTSDVLSEGQPITVWVKRLDLSGGRLSLTMVEPPKFTWNDLPPGLQTQGKVVRLEKFGAFVDIGAETDGLVHISEMGKGRVNKPSDVISEGDMITVWVKEADRKSRRISLTMMEPPEVDIHALKPDMVLTGRVVRLESFGAFVDVGAGRDGMVHVTEMGRGYVGSPSDIVSVGDEVEVRVLEVDPRRGRISLSMKDLPTDQLMMEEEEIEVPSSMELALRAAMEEEGLPVPPTPSSRRHKKSKRQRQREQDDIIARTLSSHKD